MSLHFFLFSTIFLQIVLIILLADFISGIGHWFEDAYGNPDWPILGKYVVIPNIEHHKKPRDFLKGSYIYRNSTVLVPALFFLFLLYSCGWLCWQSIFFTVYIAQVNEVHAISHRIKEENYFLLRLLQKIGLVQSNKHHGWHHKAPYNCNYCIMTEYLNPILNKIRFWERIENGLKLIGIYPIRGSEIRGGF